MKIQVKLIFVLKKEYTENGSYCYNRIKIPINQIMTTSELKALQKQIAQEHNVPLNYVGGIYTSLTPFQK